MPEPTVHPRALPSDLADDELLVRPAAGAHLAFGPEQAEWRYLSYVVHPVQEGRHLVPAVTDHEACVMIQSGHDVTISDDAGRSWSLPGRESVFDDLPSALWVPDGRPLTVEIGRPPVGGSAVVAVARAPRSGRDDVATEPILITPKDVVVETRGAGNATRQISHIIAPSFPADRLEV